MPENKEDTGSPIGNFFKALFTPRTYLAEKKYELARQEQARNTVLREFFNAFDNRDMAQIKALQPAIKGYFPDLAKELGDVETIIGEAGVAEGILEKVIKPAVGKLVQTQVPGVRATTIQGQSPQYQRIPETELALKAFRGRKEVEYEFETKALQEKLKISNERLESLHRMDDIFEQKMRDNPKIAASPQGMVDIFENVMDDFHAQEGFYPTAEEMNAFMPPEVKGAMEETQAQLSQQFERASTLRKEFAQDSNVFVTIRDSYDRVLSTAVGTAAGDLALIFNFMKMLDPASVVREGEFATAQNATGVPDRIRNLYNRIMRGERLNANQRKDFIARAKDVYEAAKRGQRKLVKDYRQISAVSGIDPRRVIVDYMYEMGKPTLPEGIPEGSYCVGQDRNTGKNIWEAPDGSQYEE